MRTSTMKDWFSPTSRTARSNRMTQPQACCAFASYAPAASVSVAHILLTILSSILVPAILVRLISFLITNLTVIVIL